MDIVSHKCPLGVTAGICPFNFPAMVPLWMFPLALIAGNTMLVKPSERDPGATIMLMELLNEAGVPPGVVNVRASLNECFEYVFKFKIFQVIHGTHDSVNFICDHKDIKAISFVGSDLAGKYIYERGARNGKRVQSNMGAKNHAIVLPDADKEATINQIIGASMGAAGQRCMAISVCILVGESQKWIPDLVKKAKELKVNAGHEPGTDVGPVISPKAKQRILDLVEAGIKQVNRS